MSKENLILAGIDYSMTSPAIVVYNGPKDEPFSHKNCKAFYFDDRKNAPLRPTCEMTLKPGWYPLWMVPEDRYQQLASWALSILLTENVHEIYLEDYAFGGSKSKPGLVFNMAENGGVLKNNLFLMGIDIKKVSPTALKLWVADHGQAKKQDFERVFKEETGIDDIRKILWLTDKAQTPISDIIDAFYLCKWGVYDKTCGVVVPEPLSKRKKPKKKMELTGLGPGFKKKEE